MRDMRGLRGGWVAVLLLASVSSATAQEPSELIMYDFEGNTQTWEIPEWATTSLDYVGKSVTASEDFASHGKGSLQVLTAFPGAGKWTGAYVEIDVPVTDWSQFGAMTADVYVPYNTPAGLQARFILTIGENWQWTEMNRPSKLKPDQWTTVTANLKPGSMDWKFFPTESFRKDIRRVGIRVESDKGPAYTGPIFIDHVRLIK